MPISYLPVSRRRFLQSSLALGAGVLLADTLAWGDDATKSQADRFIVFSDTHIAADASKIERGVNMSDHLGTAVASALAAGLPKASCVFVNGDLSLKDGQPGDYTQFVSLMKPLRDAGLPIHLSLGNHDHRDNFWQAIPPGAAVVESKHVTVVESPKVTWIVLDTLNKTNVTPGLLGAAQLKWLAAFLDEPTHASKPVLVMIHHQPERDPAATQPAAANEKPKNYSGLLDGAALMEILLPRKQVKAVINGHQHQWGLKQENGLHLVGLPAVAYTFGGDQTPAWTDWNVSDKGVEITFNTIDPKHAKDKTKAELAWR
jgi:3',5'-cyclic AMP phosphodiesterase CpdA